MNDHEHPLCHTHGALRAMLVACIIVTCAAVLYMAFANRTITVHTMATSADQTIAVEGTAETFVAPDTAHVSFGVTAKDRTTTAATTSVNSRMKNMMDALRRADVAEKDIKTVNYNLSPEYTYTDGKQRFDGYRVSQRVEVTIRNLDRVADVLDIVNTAGVDDVSQLTFFVDNEDAVREKLRTDAIANARAKAEKIADDLDVRLGSVVSFQENVGGDTPMPVYAAGMRAMNEAKEDAAVIPTGENNLVTTVQVTFTIQ